MSNLSLISSLTLKNSLLCASATADVLCGKKSFLSSLTLKNLFFKLELISVNSCQSSSLFCVLCAYSVFSVNLLSYHLYHSFLIPGTIIKPHRVYHPVQVFLCQFRPFNQNQRVLVNVLIKPNHSKFCR